MRLQGPRKCAECGQKEGAGKDGMAVGEGRRGAGEVELLPGITWDTLLELCSLARLLLGHFWSKLPRLKLKWL